MKVLKNKTIKNGKAFYISKWTVLILWKQTFYSNTNLWIKANANQILSDILLNTKKKKPSNFIKTQ